MKDLRREYASRALDDTGVDADPVTQFRQWFSEALEADLLDANAMSLATVSAEGEPSVRIVLLKGVDERGFMFYTNYESPKGQHLAGRPRASLLFFWATLERQVRISGTVSRLPREESEQYFATRPVESQWSAWASPQSAVIADRPTLERAYDAVKRQYPEQPIPCPPNWGGFALAPEQVEFWQGRPSRLHDRILYTRRPDGTWSRARLAP
ncbi:MAG: pyridoxamine 5'-phosphate oxidase [Acidobacteriota bacterium]